LGESSKAFPYSLIQGFKLGPTSPKNKIEIDAKKIKDMINYYRR
jgi:hypothetical protein